MFSSYEHVYATNIKNKIYVQVHMKYYIPKLTIITYLALTIYNVFNVMLLSGMSSCWHRKQYEFIE